MTAPFSLSSIDSSTLEWPDISGVGSKVDVLVPAQPTPSRGAVGWQQLSACIDELNATKALTKLLDDRSQAVHDRADMYLRATFTIECSPTEHRQRPATTGVTLGGTEFPREETLRSSRSDFGHANEARYLQSAPRYHGPGCCRPYSPTYAGGAAACAQGNGLGGLYGLNPTDTLRLEGDGSATGVQAWLANLAPLATLALLLGAWFVWLH